MNFVSSLVACIRDGVLGRAGLSSPAAKPLFRNLVSTAAGVSPGTRQRTATAEARTRFTPSKEARKTRSLLFAVLLLAAILAPPHSTAQIQGNVLNASGSGISGEGAKNSELAGILPPGSRGPDQFSVTRDFTLGVQP
jgi:hypothetical protein